MQLKLKPTSWPKKTKLKSECRVTIKEEPSTSVVDHKIDNLVRVVNQMMQRVTINNQNQASQNQNVQQARNQNFRRNTPKIKKREQKGLDQQIRPPFRENYTDDEGNIVEYLDYNQIILLGISDDETVFLAQEEHELFLIVETEMDSEKSREYKQGFENAITEVHRKYNLRSKKNQDTANKKNAKNLGKKVFDSDPKKTTKNPPKKTTENIGKKPTEATMKK